MSFRVTTLLFLAALLCSAQQSRRVGPAPAPPQRADFPLEAVTVEGNRQLPADKIVAASGLKIGQTVVPADFDAARKRLLETGAFENVGYEYTPSPGQTGYRAVLKV